MNTFAEMGIDENILNALASLNFSEPTLVQAQVIPLVLRQQVDLVSLAQTGTGKTAAFGLPLIQLADQGSRKTRALILCPTRELCVQVKRDLAAFARHVAAVRILAVYGGISIEQQMRALRKGVQIIVATPGRLNDLINRGMVDISAVRHVVFDEADEMLQMGFQKELNAILAKTPQEKNTLLFSATMSKEVAAIARRYMIDPVEVTIGKRNAGAENVRHEYYLVHAHNRYPALKRILDNCPDMYGIIFCRTRRETREVAEKLILDGHQADALHGELSQVQRDQVMNKFRSRKLQLLVATDVAARGLDVSDLTHVINYNLPDDIANYTHRSGRTGRAGRVGISVVLVHSRERFRIRSIESRIKRKFRQCRIPSGSEICKKQLAGLADEVKNIAVDHERIDPLYAEIAGSFESLDREELIKRLIAREFNHILEQYLDAPDLNARGNGEKRYAGKKAGHGRDPGFTRFFLNVGRRDGILPQVLIGRINDVPGGGRIKVGRIEIMRNTALMEADSRFIPQILAAFADVTMNGKSISIKVARSNHGRRRSPGHAGASRRKKGQNIKAA